MDDQPNNKARAFRAVLHPHRSLSPRGFVVLMGAVGGVSFVTGAAFLAIGAWPVFGFFGLDVALIYVAFKLNYRAGKAYEVIELTPELLSLTRVAAGGATERFEFNPYWARVRLSERPDGRNDIAIASHGNELPFGRLLNNDERREFAAVLESALVDARSTTARA